jgi:hypothetical protein
MGTVSRFPRETRRRSATTKSNVFSLKHLRILVDILFFII